MRMTADGPVDLETIDLYDLERYRSGSQHPAWARLRADAPLWRQSAPDGSQFWSVSRYADVARVIQDHRRYSSEYGTILAVTAGDPAGGRTINLMDPPRHTWVRGPSLATMSTRIMRLRRERVREHVRRIVDGCFAGGVHDFAALMLQLPMAAVGEIMDIPRECWPDVPRWAMAGVAPEDEEFATGSPAETLKQAHYHLFALFSDLIERRRRQPGDDLVSVLLRLDFGGRRMDDQHVLLNCYSFAMGAATTTPHVAAQLLLALIEQPEAWRTLRAHPGLARTATLEALRWASPTNHLMRRTTTEVEIQGRRLPAGELVCAWIGSANRDETVFREPYRFDPARRPNPHLAFGAGVHRCVGGPAAQTALTLLVEEMTARLDDMELAGEVSHLRSNFINGITHLPVEFHPRASSVAID